MPPGLWITPAFPLLTVFLSEQLNYTGITSTVCYMSMRMHLTTLDTQGIDEWDSKVGSRDAVFERQVQPMLLSRPVSVSSTKELGQMTNCDAYWHTKEQTSLWIHLVPVAFLLTCTWYPKLFPSPSFFFPYNTAISTIGSFGSLGALLVYLPPFLFSSSLTLL